MFGFGIVFLLLGSVGDFVVPLYIGFVITAMSESNYQIIGTYCLHLFLIICVSQLRCVCDLYLVFGSLCWHASLPLQHNF